MSIILSSRSSILILKSKFSLDSNVSKGTYYQGSKILLFEQITRIATRDPSLMHPHIAPQRKTAPSRSMSKAVVGRGYKPILVGESTYIGRHADLYRSQQRPILVGAVSNIGSHTPSSRGRQKEDATAHPTRGRTVASSPLSVSPVSDGSKRVLLHFFEVSIGDVVTSRLRGGGTSGRISSTSSVSVAVHLFACSLEGSLYFGRSSVDTFEILS